MTGEAQNRCLHVTWDPEMGRQVAIPGYEVRARGDRHHAARWERQQERFHPVLPSAPVHQTFGVYDGYQGSVDVGLPTSTRHRVVFFALAEDDVRGRIIITGYLVDAS